MKQKRIRKKVSECPDKIADLIEAYNYVPAKAVLKTQLEIESEAKNATEGSLISGEDLRHMNKAVLEESKYYPALKECIENQQFLGYYQSSHDVYFSYLYLRKHINKLLEMMYSHFSGYSYSVPIESDQTDVWRISDEDTWQVQSSATIAVLLRSALAGVKADRIRRCEKCLKIFWAKRKDAQACSKECSDVLAQRTYQEKKKEIEARRKTNRENVKNGKAKSIKRSKNNGTL